MRAVRLRGLLVAVGGLLWLTACETVSKNGDAGSLALASADADPAVTPSPASGLAGLFGSPAKTPDLLGADPNDDLNVGKQYYRQGSYGLAERHFRKATELHPRDAEAWMGLAAAYDQLKRFELADRAYVQALRLAGPTSEILNNQGYSYMLRGDIRRARETLNAAAARDPANPYVQNNLQMLAEASRKSKGIN